MDLLKTALLGAAICACEPAPEADPSRIDAPRIIAIHAEPPEAAPGEAVALQVVVALPDDAPLSWAWCATPKPPTENNSVDPACLADGVMPIPQTGVAVMSALPADGCRLFGPQSPGPGLRARDADITGGYFQPVRVQTAATQAIGLVRLRCNLAQAPLAAAQRFAMEYVPNQNPEMVLDIPDNVTAGQTVRLRVSSPSAEPYLRFDPQRRELIEDAETLVVSWFATQGQLAEPRTTVVDGVAEVAWTAGASGAARVYAVVRDSRGGSASAEAVVEVP
jgi:hypothetical protein